MPTFFPGTLDWQSAQPVAVGAGQTSADIVIRMISQPAFQVSGVVVDERGRPVANALIRLMPDEARESLFVRGHGMPSRTDASGQFVIGNVTHGRYTLLAIAPVVTARATNRPDGAGSGSSMSFSGGIGSSRAGGGVTTETIDGVTTEYHDATGTRVPVAIEQANVDGLEVTVRRPPR